MAKAMGVLPEAAADRRLPAADVDELDQGLSPAVERAVAIAAVRVEEVVRDWLGSRWTRLERPESIEELREALAAKRYLVDEGLATVVFLASSSAGRCWSRASRAWARPSSPRRWPPPPTPLVRLQCYEGIDVHHALYDWDYPRQLLHLRAGGRSPYSERFLSGGRCSRR